MTHRITPDPLVDLLPAKDSVGLRQELKDLELARCQLGAHLAGVDLMEVGADGELADAVLDALGKTRGLREHVTERPGQVDRHIGSTEKMERLTGWRARTSFEEGLARTIAWYRENEAWWRGILQSETEASVSSS